MAKNTIRNVKVIKTNTKFLSKNFAENGKEKLFLNDPSFCKCQNEYYPYNTNLISFCRRTLFSL